MFRWVLISALLLVCAVAAWAWLSGGFDQIAVWASARQREFQNAMAGALRALRSGDPGALTALLSVTFAYGFFHAIGPGHGKFLIGGYGVARQVGAWRLSLVALAASLLQGVTAILLVYAGLYILGWNRQTTVGAAEGWMAPASYGLIVLVGLWLAWRGLRRIAGSPSHADDHDHHHHDSGHDHGAEGHDHAHEGHACESCGHAHAPSPEAIAGASTLREHLVLVLGVAIRPCTGALFLLILTASMGISLAGILGTFSMALGTASVTIGIALSAVYFRQTTFLAFAGGSAVARVVPVLELAGGLTIVLLAGGLLLRAI